MNQLNSNLMAQELKFFSFGSTLGIFIGLGASYLVSPKYLTIFLFLYFILTCVGFWRLRHDFRSLIK